MRRFGLFGLLLVALLVAMPGAAGAEEAITSFGSRVVVRDDGSLRVTETIRVIAEGGAIRHGIYRDFPTEYPSPSALGAALGLKRRVGFKVRKVRLDGEWEDHHIEPLRNGVRVYIGRKNATVRPGPHVYKLTYETTDQLGFFEGRGELFWNVTGHGWSFPIRKSACLVVLPEGATVLDTWGATGPRGEQGRDFTVQERGPRKVLFKATRPFAAHEGWSVGVSFPAGLVQAPPSAAWRLARDNAGLLGGVGGLLLALAAYLFAWTRVGRDPRGGAVVPRWRPPDGVSPGAARYVAHMGFDDHVFAAALVGLAVRGRLVLERDAAGVYTVSRAAGGGDAEGGRELEPEEAALFADLFELRESIRLEQRNHAYVRGARTILKKALENRYKGVLFFANVRWLLPGLALSALAVAGSLLNVPVVVPAVFLSVWLTIWTGVTSMLVARALAVRSTGAWVFATVFGLGWCLGAGMLAHLAGVLPLAVIALAGGMLVLFAKLMKAPTVEGRALMDELAGLRMYLSVAEADRLNMENPPDETPELFEACLPFALALDCEQQWSERFSAVLAAAGEQAPGGGYAPRWYRGGSMSTAGLGRMGGVGAGLGASLAGAVSSAASAPGSGSGGGGGGSGGGGGGGGGGGW